MVQISTQTAIVTLLGIASGVQGCAAPKANQPSIDLVAEFEGFNPNVYKDPVGKDTVGYGHLCQQAGCAEVKYPIPLSVEDGKKLLSDDLAVAETCITMSTAQPVTLNANQYGALVSWAFNIGCPQARSSDLIQGLNAGRAPGDIVPIELPKWNKAGGRVLPGLVRRRKAELDLFNTATGDGALPAPGC
ncbi:CAZyme family GH24 [Purpureocillium lilacinum]|uniref:CAZyme family GH24 n=1 Tax=Purpureocillium lilacinum TaxID=33203 RepID=A0ABR0CCM9_PURLI|nr:CAZyme family GH24 [Purpureocillium lilacinum]